MYYTQKYNQINHTHCKGIKIIKSSKILSEVNVILKSVKEKKELTQKMTSQPIIAMPSTHPSFCKSISLDVSAKFFKSKCPWLLLESLTLIPLTVIFCSQGRFCINIVLQCPGSPQPFTAGQRSRDRRGDRSGDNSSHSLAV